MFNSMLTKQVGHFQGDGTQKTFYNGSQHNVNIIDGQKQTVLHTLNVRPYSSYAFNYGMQPKGKVKLEQPNHPKFPAFDT